MIKEIDKPKASRAKLVPPFDPPRPFDGSASPQRTFHTATASNGAHETKNKQDPFESFAQKFSRKPRIPPLLDRTDTIELSILNHGSLIPEHWGSCGGDEVHPFHDVHRQGMKHLTGSNFFIRSIRYFCHPYSCLPSRAPGQI